MRQLPQDSNHAAAGRVPRADCRGWCGHLGCWPGERCNRRRIRSPVPSGGVGACGSAARRSKCCEPGGRAGPRRAALIAAALPAGCRRWPAHHAAASADQLKSNGAKTYTAPLPGIRDAILNPGLAQRRAFTAEVARSGYLGIANERFLGDTRIRQKSIKVDAQLSVGSGNQSYFRQSTVLSSQDTGRCSQNLPLNRQASVHINQILHGPRRWDITRIFRNLE